MPRMPRCRRAPGSLEPGRVYHVTNRGVDRCDVFHSDLDRILFLSMFAEACARFGAICHAWCLMTNHFHFVVEDTTGTVSQVMHRLESTYARYFNDTRRRRRRGPLFESRFRAELVDSRDYFETACAYVLLNPLETTPPMAASVESYAWSSAALVCTETTPEAFVKALVDRAGGVEKILESLPPSLRKSSVELRRARFEALVSATWIEREHLLAGRSAEEYRLELAARTARRVRSESDVVPAMSIDEARARTHPATLCSRAPFAGHAIDGVKAAIRSACERFVPASPAAGEGVRGLVLYALHAYSSAAIDELAFLHGVTVETARATIARIRADRWLSPAWERLLWTIEWSLRWRLRCAPHRP